jgi:hypothetical protein
MFGTQVVPQAQLENEFFLFSVQFTPKDQQLPIFTMASNQIFTPDTSGLNTSRLIYFGLKTSCNYM